MDFSFIHCADLHLDSPFKGIVDTDPDMAARLQEASFNALGNIIDAAIAHNVRFVIFAGDIYNAEQRSLRAELRFIAELKRLQQAGILAYIACGNHDPVGTLPRYPNNTHVFTPDIEQCVCNSQDRDIACIYGVSFPQKEIWDNLAAQFPNKDTNLFTIGVLHGTLGTSTAHIPYAPFSKDDLTAKGYDYWALGHIHKQDIIQQRDPAIVYAGTSQGRHINEGGEKVCYLVQVADNALADIQAIPCADITWHRLKQDISAFEDAGALAEFLSDSLREFHSQAQAHAIVRLVLTGNSPLHAFLQELANIDDLLKELQDLGGPYVEPLLWLEGIETRTRPVYNLEELKQGDGFIAHFIRNAEDIVTADNLADILTIYAGTAKFNNDIAEDADALRDAVLALGVDRLRED